MEIEANQTEHNAHRPAVIVRGLHSKRVHHTLQDESVAAYRGGVHLVVCGTHGTLVQERVLATLSSFFGGLALLLAMIGLYGAISYMVMQRQTEFGVRMALGAPPDAILRLVLSDVVTILSAGVVLGTCIALLSVQLLQRLLFGLAALDTLTIVLATGVLSLVAFIAGCLPARRATKVDPMVALRYE